MPVIAGFLRRHLVRVTAAVLAVGVYGLTRLPGVPAADAAALAGRFQFTRLRLPEPQGQIARSIRTVHPDLKRIAGWISSVGASVALADLDGDGLPNDVCHVDPRYDSVTVLPAPGTPRRYKPVILSPAPLPYDPATMAPMGCLPGDLNEDGRMDLLVYYWGRTPVLFLRQPDGQGYLPTEVLPGGERWFTNTATTADLDGDGHLDLVFGNYFPDGSGVLDATGSAPVTMQHSMSEAFNGGGPRFLLWQGAGAEAVRFEEARGVLGREPSGGWTLAVGAADLDGDLLPEIYLANDFGPDRLLHNRSTPGHLSFGLLEGRADFTTPKSSVLGRDSFKGMGVDFVDLTGDGLLDLYVSNIANPYALVESHFLWVNQGHPERMKAGEAPFVNQSEAFGLARSGWGWDVKAGDFDNDGVPEIVQATGFLKGETNRWPELQELATGNDTLLANPQHWPRFQPGDDLSGSNLNPFFVRGADGRYVDVARQIGLNEPLVTRGIATADIDGDGHLDFVTATQWGASYLYHNECRTCGQFLGLHLQLPLQPDATAVTFGHPAPGTLGRPAVGAAVTVYLPDGRKLVGQADGGNGHSGRRSPDLFYGLGSVRPDQPLLVEIRWRDPSGALQQQQLRLTPGWHTVRLGWPGGKEG